MFTELACQKRYLLLFSEMVVRHVVYNKKKIQMFSVRYGFYFTREVKRMYVSLVFSSFMKCKYSTFHSMKCNLYSTKTTTFEYPVYIVSRNLYNGLIICLLYDSLTKL